MKLFDCLGIILMLFVFTAGCAAAGDHVPATESFTFVQVADPQLGWGYGYANDLNSFKQAVSHINGLKPDLVVICGDMVDSFNTTSVADFQQARSALTMPSYCAPGNHDVGNEPTVARLESYRQAFGDDYFSFEHKGYTFVIVDMPIWKWPVAGETEKLDQWLKDTLAAAHAKGSPIFIVGHHPLYLTNPTEAEEYYNLPPAKRAELLDLFVQYGVVAVLGGHRHLLLINEYMGIQLVNGETTCRHFDNSPLGFRLWRVDSPTSITHEFRPLVPPKPKVDFNGDGIVDRADMAIMIAHWLEDYPPCDVAPPPFGDGIVDEQDVVYLSEHMYEDYRLAAHWKFDEADGVTAFDSAGVNNATTYGNPVWMPTEGREGGALQFDGIDDYVGTPSILDPSEGPLSVYAWIKGGKPGQVIISQTGTPWGSNWLRASSLDGGLITELKGTGRWDRPLVSDSIITDGDWHHIGLTWDGSNRTLYVDDVEVISDAHSPLGSASGDLNIGAGKNLDRDQFFAGLIDDVRIYNKALSPAEIQPVSP